MQNLILGSTSVSLETKSPFSIDSDYKADFHCWRHTMKKRLAKNNLKASTVELEPRTGQLLCFTG